VQIRGRAGIHTALWSYSHNKNIFSDCLKWLYDNKSSCLKSVGR